MARRVPVIDLSNCSRCGVCVEVAPAVFHFNCAGYVEVLECPVYAAEPVDDAVKNCPERCIEWST